MTTPARPEAGTRLEQLAERFDAAMERCALYGNADQVRDCWAQLKAEIFASPAPVRASGEPKELMSRGYQRAYERLELCPDHRDKSNGRCIVCVAEERTRAEIRVAAAVVPSPPRAAREQPLFPKDHPAICYERCDPAFEILPHVHTPKGVYVIEVEP